MSTPIPSSTARGLSVRSILPASRRIACEDLRFRSCCGTWADCQPGDLFVAIETPEGDGHDHADEALRRGAVGIVAERLLAVAGPQFLVDDTRLAFGTLCHALAGRPAEHLTTVAVGGSDGKTVTGHLVEAVLAAAGESTAISSCWSASSGSACGMPRSRVDDCPASLSAWLEQQVREERTAVVVETGSAALAQHALAGAAFDTAIVTNIRSDESGQHGSDLNYRRVQERILAHLKPGGLAILNADDPHSARLLSRIEVPVLTVGIRQDADLSARLIESDPSGQTFCLAAGQEAALVRTPTIGVQHIYNCLAAAAVGLSRGLDLSRIAQALSGCPPLPGKLERVWCGEDLRVWIDSASRPGPLATAMHAVRQVTRGRLLIAVTMDPSQSWRQRQRIGEIIERRSDVAVITQPDAGMIREYEPAHQILDGMQDPGKARLIPGRISAIEWLLGEARRGDSVLLAGTGDSPVAIIGESGAEINDRDIVQSWMQGRSPAAPPCQHRGFIHRLRDYGREVGPERLN